MRIAIVVRSLAFGGMEKVAISLSEAFSKEGHESHLIYFNETSNKLPTPKNVYLHSFQLKESMKKSLFGIGYSWKIISQVLNMIVRNSYFVWSGLYTGNIFKKKLFTLEQTYGKFDLIIFRGQGTFEMIWTNDDSRFVFVNESLIFKKKYGYLQKIYAKLLFNNRNIVSISTGVQDSFKKIQKSANFKAKKHCLITNPIDIEETSKLASLEIELPENAYIVTAGRFHQIKNFPLLVEAYAYAREHLNLKLDLVILGEGKERENIETSIAKFSLQSHIHLPGYMSNPYPWIKNAELFVLTSKIEGLGMVLLESMACGTDIVVTNSPGGIKDIMRAELREHVCEADKIVLAKKIVEVLENPISNFDKYLEPYRGEKISTQFIEQFISS